MASNQDLMERAFSFSLEMLDRMQLDGNITDEVYTKLLEDLKNQVLKRLEVEDSKSLKRAVAANIQKRKAFEAVQKRERSKKEG